VFKRAGNADVIFGSRTFYVPVTNASPLPIHPPPKVVFATPPTLRSRIKLGIASSLILSLMALAAVWYVGRRRQRLSVEAERAYMARDLHDGLGASLARLQVLQEPALAAETAHLSTALKEVSDATKGTIWLLDPAQDKLDDLVGFLLQQAEHLFTETGVRCFTEAPTALPDVRLSPEERKNLCLTVREALANVLKHALATTVWLRIATADRTLRIHIEDNGVGLPAAPGQHFGNGLRNMRIRMAEIGGQIEISPREGGGTCVALCVKLKRRRGG
jgi:signal transduction histidine kinase